jgi:processive 1,2-diacylglycerol beta-glucosyltransferase
VLELGTFLHPTIMPIIYHAYRKTLTSSPRLYAMLYQKQNKMLSRF